MIRRNFLGSIVAALLYPFSSKNAPASVIRPTPPTLKISNLRCYYEVVEERILMAGMDYEIRRPLYIVNLIEGDIPEVIKKVKEDV